MNIKKCTNVSSRALHLCKKAHCGKLALWAFLHRWRALPETFVHFLMFIDTFKSFSLTFYSIYSATHHFSIFQFTINHSRLTNHSARIDLVIIYNLLNDFTKIHVSLIFCNSCWTKPQTNLHTEDVVYSYLLLVLTSRRVTVQLK